MAYWAHAVRVYVTVNVNVLCILEYVLHMAVVYALCFQVAWSITLVYEE